MPAALVNGHASPPGQNFTSGVLGLIVPKALRHMTHISRSRLAASCATGAQIKTTETLKSVTLFWTLAAEPHST